MLVASAGGASVGALLGSVAAGGALVLSCCGCPAVLVLAGSGLVVLRCCCPAGCLAVVFVFFLGNRKKEVKK